MTRLSASGAVALLTAALEALNEVGGAVELELLGAVPGRDGALLRPKLNSLERPADGGDEGAVSRWVGSALGGESKDPLVDPGEAGAVPGRLLSFLERKFCFVGLGVVTSLGDATSSCVKLLFDRGEGGAGPARLPCAGSRTSGEGTRDLGCGDEAGEETGEEIEGDDADAGDGG